jgi:hypothetical protein
MAEKFATALQIQNLEDITRTLVHYFILPE